MAKLKIEQAAYEEGRLDGIWEAIAVCDAFRSDGQTHAVALILTRQIAALLSPQSGGEKAGCPFPFRRVCLGRGCPVHAPMPAAEKCGFCGGAHPRSVCREDE